MKNYFRQLANPAIGKALNFGNERDTIWVDIPGFAGSVQAIAASAINSSQVVVVFDTAGQAWVRAESAPQLQSQRTTEFFKLNPEQPAEPRTPYPIKVLFATQETDLTWSFWIGGDRPQPTKIYSLPKLPTEAHLSNLGIGLDDWVVGIKTDLAVINIFGTDATRFICDESFSRHLKWKGAGIWSYNTGPPTIIYTQTYYNIVTDGNTEVATTLLLEETGVYSTNHPFLTASGTYRYYFEINTGTEVSINESFEGKTFLFHKGLTSKSGFYERTVANTRSPGGFSAFVTVTETDYRRTTIPFYLSKDNIINWTQTYDYEYTHTVLEGNAKVVSYRQIINTTDISAITSGAKTHAYRNRKTNDARYVRSSPDSVLTVISDAVAIERSSTDSKPPTQISKIPYQSPLDSIKPDLGATLKGGNYFLIPPSTITKAGKAIYTTGAWRDKTIEEYAALPNVYDNPEPTSRLVKVPVWTISFSEDSFEVLSDREATVLPLLANPTIFEASYYPI
jgi:hypothetical protein